jgi:hypothetical protein
MSTVQSLYDFLQYRKDIQVSADDLIHIVNGAVRSISKRLYVLGSSLVVGRMAVNIYQEITYTASLVFVDSNPDTITDAANQFVIEGFEVGMPITTSNTTNPGPYRLQTVTAGILTLASAESITAAGAASTTITVDDSIGYLPSDFWGLADKPYISGKKYPLLPSPSVDVELQYTTGDPIYYKIQGTKLYVIPSTGADYTVIADYYKKATELTATTDTLPYSELFDDLMAEYVMLYFRGPQSGAQIMTIDKLVRDGVDLVAMKFDKKAPVVGGGINWNYLMGR